MKVVRGSLFILLSIHIISAQASALPSLAPPPRLSPISIPIPTSLPTRSPVVTPPPYTVFNCYLRLTGMIDSIPDDFPGANAAEFQQTCERLAAECRVIPPDFSEPLPGDDGRICSRNKCLEIVGELCGIIPPAPPLSIPSLCLHNSQAGPVCELI